MSPKNLGHLQYSNRSDITFLGRFVPDKQPFLAIDSFLELRKLGWEGKLHIIGSGPLANQIKERVEQLQIGHRVIILENAAEKALQECLLKSFILIHPSKREGYGLAMIEAAERQIPTLLINYPENASVDLGISPEYVSASDDPRNLAQFLKRAYEKQESDWNRLGSWKIKDLPSMNAHNSVARLLEVIEGELLEDRK